MKARSWATSGALCALLMLSGAAVAAQGNKKRASAVAAPHIIPQHFLRTKGRRIESGLRVETAGDKVHVAQRVFPPGGEPHGVALPEHLGGGYLFYQPVAVDGSTYTAFYRSKTFTGGLTPLGRIPFAVHHVALGFDRVYALGVSLQAAFDAQTGELLPLAPLPPLPTITGLAFAGARRALVSAPLVGVLYSGDAGLTWKTVQGAQSIAVDLDRAHLFVRTASGLARVDEEGEILSSMSRDFDVSSGRIIDFERVLSGQVGAEAFDPETKGSPGPGSTHRDLWERRWIALLSRGVPKARAAWAIEGGRLLRLELNEELKLTALPTQVAPTATCLGTIEEGRKNQDPLFICQDGDSSVTVYRARLESSSEPEDEGAVLSPLLSAEKGVEVLTWGRGGVLLASDCNGRKEEGVACLVGEKGATALQIPKGATTSASRHTFATTSRAAWVLYFEGKSGSVKSQQLASKGSPDRKPRSFRVPADHAISDFLKHGSMLSRASKTSEGLTFWATHREKFVGVLLSDGDKPSFGAVQRPLRRAVFDGPRAVVWGAAGFAKQSVDGGQTFEEISLPYRSGDPELATVAHPNSAVTMGCSAVGCSLGRLLKLGWSVPRETEEEIPKARPYIVPGSARLRFSCGSAVSSPERKENEEALFPSFWEKPAPAVAGGQEGSSVGFPAETARLYAWGPVDGVWSRAGRAKVEFVDPWDVTKIRSSASTLQFYSSSLDARTRMGLIDQSSAFRYLSMDPDGASGVMLLRGASTTEVVVFEEGKPLEAFAGAHDLGHRNLAGAVRSRASFAAAFVQGETLSLVRLLGGKVVPFADFELGDAGQRGVQLVRTQDGDLGIAMEGDSGLFVYPVSDQGDLGEPTILAHGAETSRPCEPEARGFIVDRDLAVSPYIESADGQPLPVTRIRAKLIVGYGRSCIEGLRGQARGLRGQSARAAAGAGIPLSLLNTESYGERTQLLCE